jgi:hypothetical protein
MIAIGKDAGIRLALERAFGWPASRRRSPGSSWVLSKRGESDSPLHASIEGEWLTLWRKERTGIAPVAPATDWLQLGRSAGLPGSIRPARSRDGGREWRAEVRLGEECDLVSRLNEARRGFARAWGESAPPEGTVLPLDLEALCRGMDWPFTVRGEGRMTVSLETPQDTGFYTAEILLETCGDIRVTAEFWSGPLPSSESQEAMARFLLEAAGYLYGVRLCQETQEGHVVVRGERRFSPPLSPSELRAALAALSVTARHLGREVRLLLYSDVAREYLAMQGDRAAV